MNYWNECCTKTDTEWHWHLEPDGSLFIEFEGSTSKLDWLQNFRFLRVVYKDMPTVWRAHAGFVEKWHSIRDRFLEVVAEYGSHGVWLQGYSQGGALATLAHEDVWWHWPELRTKLHTITYGAPRTVSWCAPDNRWIGLTAVWLGWDIVHQVPPWLFGYKHVGVVQHIGRKWVWPLLSVRDHLRYEERPCYRIEP